MIRIAIDLLDHWQTLIAGVLALAAGVLTVVVTRRVANRQIAASREEADRVIAATREQTKVTAEQTATTVRLEQDRVAGEASAFRAMLDAAMVRVLAEVKWAREVYPQALEEKANTPAEVLAVRQCITKGGFAELRAACVRRGDPLTREFLDLERVIDTFARQYEDRPSPSYGTIIRVAFQADLGTQLNEIGEKANTLRLKIAERN